jgi:peptidoglycan hydrolase CwlO-like protein
MKKRYKRVTEAFIVATKEAIGRPESVVKKLVDEVPDCKCDDLRAKLDSYQKQIEGADEREIQLQKQVNRLERELRHAKKKVEALEEEVKR